MVVGGYTGCKGRHSGCMGPKGQAVSACSPQPTLRHLPRHPHPLSPCPVAAAGANYRSVWAMHKNYPHVKTYVRAHDINHGLNLEKAGVRGRGLSCRNSAD